MSQEEYLVEKIIGQKIKKGKKFYKVKWANYSSLWDTWEPSQNLQHLDLLIEQFEEKQEQVRQSKSNHQERFSLQCELEFKSKRKTSQRKTSQRKIKIKQNDDELNHKPFIKNYLKPQVPSLDKSQQQDQQVNTDDQQQLSEQYGSFIFKDKVETIIGCKKQVQQRKLYFEVKWQKREDKTVPLNTMISQDLMKLYEKDLLLDFYERHIQLR